MKTISPLRLIIFVSVLLAAQSVTASADVIELHNENQEEAAMHLASNEFNVISFYKPSEPETLKVDALMEQSKTLFDSKIESGEWTKRSVGWFRVNLDKNPEMAWDTGKPSQIVMGNQQVRKIGFELSMGQEMFKDAELFAMIVKDLTGDWFVEIKCEDIKANKQTRRYYDQIIYFGPKADIEEGGGAVLMNELSMMDRYNFDQQRVGFFINEDPNCAKEQYDLDPQKVYIVFAMGDAKPEIMVVNEDDITLQQLVFTMNTQIVKATPKWGQRAHSVFFDHRQNGLIYYMDDATTPEALKADWRITLMVQIAEWVQEYPSTMVPIVWSWKGDDQPQYVKPLRDVIGAKLDELPQIFLYHGMSGETFRYPEAMSDPYKISPELVILWAKMTIADKELDMFTKRLAQDDQEEDAEKKLTAEMRLMILERLEVVDTDAKELKEADAEMRKLFLEGDNTFGDYANAVHDLGLNKSSESEEDNEVHEEVLAAPATDEL